MNQTEHSDRNLSLALKAFPFSFEECRPYTAIRHLIRDSSCDESPKRLYAQPPNGAKDVW